MNDKSTMNKIMEYMALGKPIVQFDLTEGRFSTQEASLYARKNDEIDMAEKIVQLLDDPTLREQIGRIGRARVETQLAWKYQVPVLLRAYDRVFASRLRCRPVTSAVRPLPLLQRSIVCPRRFQ
jgi:glycosyltransferase involved in cell wall biosynthesis